MKSISNAYTRNCQNKLKSYNCCLIDKIWFNHYNAYKQNQSENKKKNIIRKKINIEKPSKIVILNTLEDVKNYIQNNISFEIVFEDYLNSIESFYKKNVKIILRETYFGLNKIIIRFNDENNIKYLLFRVKQNKYYEFVINDNQLIRQLYNYDNIFGKNSKFKNIKFIPINNINNFQKSQNYINPITNSIVTNSSIPNNNIEEEKNISNNNKISNNIRHKSIKKIDNNITEIRLKNNVDNNELNINNKINNLNIINNENNIEIENDYKRINYEKEKEKLILQKKINQSLLKDLERVNQLPKLMNIKQKLNKEIDQIKIDIQNQDNKIYRLKREIELEKPQSIESKYNGRNPKRYKSYKNQIKDEQIKKQYELEYTYKNILLEDKYKKLNQLIYIKQLYEEKLKEKGINLLELKERIKKEYEVEKDFNKKQEFIKSLLENNQEELEKLNKLNIYED